MVVLMRLQIIHYFTELLAFLTIEHIKKPLSI